MSNLNFSSDSKKKWYILKLCRFYIHDNANIWLIFIIIKIKRNYVEKYFLMYTVKHLLINQIN